MDNPYVSCIMPTANRPNYIPLAVEHFLNQTYRNVELIIVDDGKVSVKEIVPSHHRVKYFYSTPLGSIGNKRNYACSLARGQIIMHWDDDDYYAYDWIERQLKALEESGADIVGLNQIYFYSALVKKFWNYENKDQEQPWLSGATLAYRRAFWEKHPFKDINIGEDYDYIWNTGARIYAHSYPNGFIATLHAGNTTMKPFEDRRHKKNASIFMDVEYKGNTENPEKSRSNLENL